MRLGVSTDFGAKSAEEWVRKNKELGLKSVVFPLSCKDDSEKIDEYVKAAREADLMIAEVGIWRNAIDENADSAKTMLQYSIDQLLLADRIQARCAVNVAGAFAGERWDGPHKDNFSKEAWVKTVKMIQTVIDEAKPQNSFFSLEPMPWMLPTGPEEYLHLIEDVGRDRFAVHMDIINMICTPDRFFFGEEFMEKTFSLLKGKIKSCHIKDVKLLPEFTFQLRECACGEGTFNLEKYVELANAEDPEMPMIIEHLHGDNEYVESVSYVKKRLGA